MIKFFHYPLCPISRQIRMYLKEMDLVGVSMIQEFYWERRREFVEINPASTVPVLIIDNNNTIIGYYAITEFFKENFDKFFLMPENLEERNLVREKIYWFNEKFYREVSKIILEEKMIRLLKRKGSPRSEYIRAAKNNLLYHLKYMTDCLAKNYYIASEYITCADIAAASHVSTIDYFGEINWDSFPLIKEWYSIVKSRPSFKTILQDNIAGFIPQKDYANLDF